MKTGRQDRPPTHFEGFPSFGPWDWGRAAGAECFQEDARDGGESVWDTSCKTSMSASAAALGA